MSFVRAQDYKAEKPWGAKDIANIEGASVRLHWTDKPYKWHVNDGEEVFVVLDGTVDMHFMTGGIADVKRMRAGDLFHAGFGAEHKAEPVGEARVLVIEKKGSI